MPGVVSSGARQVGPAAAGRLPSPCPSPGALPAAVLLSHVLTPWTRARPRPLHRRLWARPLGLQGCREQTATGQAPRDLLRVMHVVQRPQWKARPR